MLYNKFKLAKDTKEREIYGMKKKIVMLFMIAIVALQLGACSFEPHCKESGCEETNIYEEGYCKYHYYIKTGEELIKDIIN